jgi:hypothetical protein
MKKMEREEPIINRITTIIQTKHCYFGYLADVFFVVKIARTPENDLAFETEDWDFLEQALNIAENLEAER